MDEDKNNQSLDGIKPSEDDSRVQKINISVDGDEKESNTQDQTNITETQEVKEPESLTDNTNIAIDDSEPQNHTVSVADSALSETVDTKQDQPEPEMPIQQAVNTPSVASLDPEVVKLKERNKALKIWLVVFIVIIVAVLSALVVYFFQNSKAQSELDKQQSQNLQLQAQISQQQKSATQEQINSLNTEITTLKQQNDTLTKQVKAQSDYITTLTKTANQLKTTCGSDCSSIVIPAPPASTTATTNNSSSN